MPLVTLSAPRTGPKGRHDVVTVRPVHVAEVEFRRPGGGRSGIPRAGRRWHRCARGSVRSLPAATPSMSRPR